MDLITKLICMLCGQPALDAANLFEVESPLFEETTIVWCYCKACDVWTEHPESILE